MAIETRLVMASKRCREFLDDLESAADELIDDPRYKNLRIWIERDTRGKHPLLIVRVARMDETRSKRVKHIAY